MLLNRLKRRVRWMLLGPEIHYWTSDLSSGEYSILSTRPPIFYVAHWMDNDLGFMCSMEQLFEYLKDDTAYFLYDWFWSIEDPGKIAIVKQLERRHKRRHRRHHFIHLCNTPHQLELFQEQGLTAIFCNQNAFSDDRIFKPLPNISKRYSAVYDARIKAYKRHHLAARVDNLALIYDFKSAIDDEEFVQKTRQQFQHAYFFNHPDSSAYVWLTPAELNRCLNSCKVGLCLSALEGAMYASIQYLLAGLPVVSTRSNGGRDVFFDDEYVLIVDDTPEAVSEGVEQMARRNIAPELIRNKTLEKIMPHRQRIVSLVQSIYEAESVDRDFSVEWESVFFDKLVRRQLHAETISILGAAK